MAKDITINEFDEIEFWKWGTFTQLGAWGALFVVTFRFTVNFLKGKNNDLEYLKKEFRSLKRHVLKIEENVQKIDEGLYRVEEGKEVHVSQDLKSLREFNHHDRVEDRGVRNLALEAIKDSNDLMHKINKRLEKEDGK